MVSLASEAPPSVSVAAVRYGRHVRRAVDFGLRADWPRAAAEALRALALVPDDAYARRLLLSVERELAATHPGLASRIRRALGVADAPPALRARPRPTTTARAPHRARQRNAGGAVFVRGYLNAIVSCVLLMVLVTGGGSVGGTFAYFTNRQTVPTQAFQSTSLPAPTITNAAQSGSAINLQWSALSYADYEVYAGTSSSGPFALAASLPSTTVNSQYNYTPPKDGTYYFQVLPKLSSGWPGTPAVTGTIYFDTSPSVTSFTPPSGTVDVSVYSTLSAVFSEAMVTATATLERCDGAADAAAAMTCSTPISVPTLGTTASADNTTFTFDPIPTSTVNFETGAWYRMTIGTGWTESATVPSGGTLKSLQNAYTTVFKSGIATPRVDSVTLSAPVSSTLLADPFRSRVETNPLRLDVTAFNDGTIPTVNAVTIAFGTAPDSTTNCVQMPTTAPYTATVTWDGKKTDGVTYVSDGTIPYTVTAYSSYTDATTCSGVLETSAGRSLRIANASTVAVDPLPHTVTLGAGSYSCVTALVTDSLGSVMPDGAPITFTSSSSNGGTHTLDQPTTGKIGGGVDATTPCPAPTAGTGKAVAKLTVNTAAQTIITVNATVGNITGTTRFNDPPSPPTNLRLSPGSIRVTFTPSSSPTTAGYYIHIGTAPGSYDRLVDAKNSTDVHITDGIVGGRRYYVAVQAYDVLGQTSALTSEESIVAPAEAAPAAIALTAAPLTPGALMKGGARITAAVTDSSGRPAGGNTVRFSGPAGVSFAQTDVMAGPDGIAETTMTVTDPALVSVLVRATSGSVSASADLLLVAPTATPTQTPTRTPEPTATSTSTPPPTAEPATATATPTATATATAEAVAALATATSGSGPAPSGTTATATATGAPGQPSASASPTVAPARTTSPTPPPASGSATATPSLTRPAEPAPETPTTAAVAATTSTAAPTSFASATSAPVASATSSASTAVPTASALPPTAATSTPVAPATSTPAPQATDTPAPVVTGTPASAATQPPATALPSTPSVPSATQPAATQVTPTQAPATQVPSTQPPATSVPSTPAPATPAPTSGSTTVPAPTTAPTTTSGTTGGTSTSGSSSTTGAATATVRP